MRRWSCYGIGVVTRGLFKPAARRVSCSTTLFPTPHPPTPSSGPVPALHHPQSLGIYFQPRTSTLEQCLPTLPTTAGPSTAPTADFTFLGNVFSTTLVDKPLHSPVRIYRSHIRWCAHMLTTLGGRPHARRFLATRRAWVRLARKG